MKKLIYIKAPNKTTACFILSQERSKRSSNSMLDLSGNSNSNNGNHHPNVGIMSAYRNSMPTSPTTSSLSYLPPPSAYEADGSDDAAVSSASRSNGFGSTRNDRFEKDESHDSEDSVSSASPLAAVIKKTKEGSSATALVIGDELVNQDDVSIFYLILYN